MKSTPSDPPPPPLSLALSAARADPSAGDLHGVGDGGDPLGAVGAGAGPRAGPVHGAGAGQGGRPGASQAGHAGRGHWDEGEKAFSENTMTALERQQRAMQRAALDSNSPKQLPLIVCS